MLTCRIHAKEDLRVEPAAEPQVGPGEVLLLQADIVDESIEFIRHYLASRLEAHAITLEEVPAMETPAEADVAPKRGAAVLR